jgi:DNA-3-methyladenine glycosylase II
MVSMTVDTPKEFSFRQCLHFLNRSANELLHVTQEDRVEKLIRIEDRAMLFSVSEPLKGKLKIHFPQITPSAKAKQAIKEYVLEWFDLKTDLRPFYLLAGKDEMLKPLVKRYYGYRIVSMPDLFESLCWAVIGQQINLSFAYLLKKTFRGIRRGMHET